MKLEINYKDKEYFIVLNGKEVFKWKNFRRILRETRDILEKHNTSVQVGLLKYG